MPLTRDQAFFCGKGGGAPARKADGGFPLPSKKEKERLEYENSYKLNSILRRHYGFIMMASWEKIFSVIIKP